MENQFADIALEELFTAPHPLSRELYHHFYQIIGKLNEISETRDLAKEVRIFADHALDDAIRAAQKSSTCLAMVGAREEG